MTQTFEERIGQELDALYQGARFLTGGRQAGAEELVIDTVTLARGEYPWKGDPKGFSVWIERCLVRAFLRLSDPLTVAGPSETPSVRGPVAPDALRSIGANELYRAAGKLPPGPRVAVWLVVFRRWGYAESAEALGVERPELRELLRHRDVLLQTLLVDAGRRKDIIGFGS